MNLSQVRQELTAMSNRLDTLVHCLAPHPSDAKADVDTTEVKEQMKAVIEKMDAIRRQLFDMQS